MAAIPKKVVEWGIVAGELRYFLLQPRLFVRAGISERGGKSPTEILLAAVAFAFVILAVHQHFFGGLMDSLQSSFLKREMSEDQSEKLKKYLASRTQSAERFSIIGAYWLLPIAFDLPLAGAHIKFRFGAECGAGVELPEGLYVPPNMPQLAVVNSGCFSVSLKDFTPARVNTTSAVIALSSLSITMASGLWLALIMLRSKVPFATHFRLSMIWFSSLFLITVAAAVVSQVIAVEVFGLGGIPLWIFWIIFVVIPVAGLGIRSLFGAFSELYSVRKRKLMGAFFLSFLISNVVSPFTLLPALVAVNWFGDVIEKILG